MTVKMTVYVREDDYDEDMERDEILAMAVGESGLEDMFDELLDEVYDTVEIAGCEYTASDVLRSTDPIAYQEGLADYMCRFVEVETTFDEWWSAQGY